MLKARLKILCLGSMLLVVYPLIGAAVDIHVKQVMFAKGAASATIKETIVGETIIDYKLRARAGQTMTVTLETDNDANYFNVLPPRSEAAAIAIGSILGNQWTGTLPVDGDYTVRVYLMRSAARRNEIAHYVLSVGIAGTVDAKVEGTPFHATGLVPCSVGSDPKGSTQCSFGVIRSIPGYAEIHLVDPGYDVTLHKSDVHVLKFAVDVVSTLDPGDKVIAVKEGDNWSISVNDVYFYIIPEAVISGG